MKPIVILASVPQELALLVRSLGARPLESGRPTYLANAGKRQVIIACGGLGKVNAASAATSLIERFSPGLIVTTGCAGAYLSAGLAVGDLAVATAEVFAEEGVITKDGWQGLDLIGIPAAEVRGQPYYNEFPLSLLFAERAMRLAASIGVPLMRGRFVTVSACSGTTERGDELAARFNAICETMEGAAVAQTALLYGVDCLEIRGVSNLVEDRDLSRWDIPLAVEGAQRFLLKFLESYEE